MTISPADAAAIERVRAALADAAARLAAADARTEARARYQPAHRTLGVPRAERLIPAGRVWRLGVLLLGADADESTAERAPTLYATGALTRPHEPGRSTYIAASAERRRELRVAAYRGHFAPGESVNFNAPPIALDESLVEVPGALPLGASRREGPSPSVAASGPLLVRDGAALVRWSPTAPDALADFESYLADRVALLVTPPEGA
jgi:hypothetical protein